MEPHFKIFAPCELLRPYIKFYWLCTCDEDVRMEMMFPSGCMEMCIDVSNGNTTRHFGNRVVTMPGLEVLGHFMIPTRATIKKDTTVLVTRFYPYASALFFPNQAAEFTNDSINLFDVLKMESLPFYDQLLEAGSIEKKIELLEAFLIQRVKQCKRNPNQHRLAEHLCNLIDKTDESFNLKKMADSINCSERYIQKLFNEWIGVTPKTYHNITRFNRSLTLIESSSQCLTSIAYQCGYFDQAHFIKEFKSFTGITPSQLGHC